jgi:unsaturated rhamnogalacturonyl hydrolase
MAMTRKAPPASKKSSLCVWLAGVCSLACVVGACRASTGSGRTGGADAAFAADMALGRGGATGAGDAASTGGGTGTGGAASTGGATGAGGAASTAGASGAGTTGAAGGTAGVGGMGSGGVATGGANGKGGSAVGGATASGGTVATTGGVTGSGGGGAGAVTGAGGVAGRGGVAGTGGVAGAGGVAGMGGGTGGGLGTGGSSAGLPAAADILAILKKVIPYEIQLGPEDPSWVNKWTEATFYIGVMAAYLATGDQSYLTSATAWATGNKWTLLGSPTRSADNQCAGQVYADIYLADLVAANANMVANLKTNIDAMVASPKPGISQSAGDDWWWCDALFMAPGAVSRLGKISGQATYFSFLDTMWSATQAGLFDSATGLFWRDSSFVNGTVYWSRGNGWVMAGVVRVLQYLPPTDASHDAYVGLLDTMAAAVVPYQQADGTWHADLTHPTKYNNPEVSGTGLMTYAMAYGINQGLLARATYLPVVVAAWNGMVKQVDGQGRVGYIQATGSAPAAATATETHDYGVGAFVLAASELYRMVK